MFIRLSSLIAAATLALAALSFSPTADAQYRDRGGDRYDRRPDVCQYCGTVRSISRINRSSRRTNATILGALVGGAIGNQIGSGDGRRAATVAGAVAGGAIGNNAAKDRNSRTIYRISVRMDTGRSYTFDQDTAYRLRPGSRVEIRDGWVEPLR